MKIFRPTIRALLPWLALPLKKLEIIGFQYTFFLLVRMCKRGEVELRNTNRLVSSDRESPKPFESMIGDD